MNADVKRHIDSARDVLVGVVPNPTSQIDQITNALVYKFMDDMDQNAIKAGGEPSFFVGELEKYAWSRLIDTRVGNQEKMNLFAEALVKFSESEKLPELFRNIFKSAFLPYRSPEVLGMFLKEINYFDYTHPEDLGDAYEYLLSIMSSQGDAGQFRTPRHIIDFIVEVVNPTKNDKVLDPACGTAGFLISAYKNILKQHDGKDDPEHKEKPLTPDDRKALMTNFEGYDIDPGMVRIAQVNMYLHQFRNPKIFQYDTLSMEERWNDKFDVILANPPFMSPKGGIKPHSKFSVKSNRSEVLFVDYIMNHLRPRGRAGVIVPEGVIFQSGTAYKQLRKNLVNDGLYAVVSLPAGIFNPYSGVKTSILLFDSEFAKSCEKILFVKLQNDGTDLGVKKKITEKNDIPLAITSIASFKTGKFVPNDICHVVDKKVISKDGEFNLSGERYKEVKSSVNGEYEMVDLGSLIEECSERVKGGTFEVWSVSNVKGFVKTSEIFSKEIASENIDNYKIISPQLFAYNPSRINVGSIAYNSSLGFGAVSPMYVVFKITEDKKLLPEFLFALLKSEIFNKYVQQYAQGAVRQQLKFSDLKRIEIPLPPLDVQEQTVAELDGYQKIIDGAKMVIENWNPIVKIPNNCVSFPLKQVCLKITDGSHNPPPSTLGGGEIMLSSQNIRNGAIDIENVREISSADFNNEDRRTSVQDGDVLLTIVGTIGRSAVVENLPKRITLQRSVAVLKTNTAVLDPFYLSYLLRSKELQFELNNKSAGVAQKGIYLKTLGDIIIPVPEIKLQKKIVEEIKAEQSIIEKNQELIGKYLNICKTKIKEVWGE